LSRKKSNAARQDPRFPRTKNVQSFYMKEAKTIDFAPAQPLKVVRPSTKPVQLVPKSINQEKYIIALLDEYTDIVVVSGPAGTGKTYLAMLAAIKALRTRECDRIILTRPAVGVDDEKHGFLPGDLNQKMEPWTRPLLDVLREYYSAAEIAHMLAEGTIEISPLAFMRGRTFKHAIIIADEMQNATPAQTKMLLTRIGVGSKIVVTGDNDQSDRRSSDDGLADLVTKVKKENVSGISICEFETKDIQRHPMITHVLKMYTK
jgi:phosphate starvation-inducible PhoH-like protein